MWGSVVILGSLVGIHSFLRGRQISYFFPQFQYFCYAVEMPQCGKNLPLVKISGKGVYKDSQLDQKSNNFEEFTCGFVLVSFETGCVSFNEKGPPQSLAFEHVVPDWWCSLGMVRRCGLVGLRPAFRVLILKSPSSVVQLCAYYEEREMQLPAPATMPVTSCRAIRTISPDKIIYIFCMLPWPWCFVAATEQ